MVAPLTAEEFRQLAGVSRETLSRLEAYVACLERWQRAVNLVGRRSLADVWRRHVLDSAQLLPLAPGARVWLDLGSGAGLPGLVLAIVGAPVVHLVEADGRKCAFLREAARAAAAQVTLHEGRIEALAAFPVDVVTARALKPLKDLFPLVARFMGEGTVALLLKGQDVGDELTQASKSWKMTLDRLPSASDPRGTILRLSSLARA